VYNLIKICILQITLLSLVVFSSMLNIMLLLYFGRVYVINYVLFFSRRIFCISS